MSRLFSPIVDKFLSVWIYMNYGWRNRMVEIFLLMVCGHLILSYLCEGGGLAASSRGHVAPVLRRLPIVPNPSLFLFPSFRSLVPFLPSLRTEANWSTPLSSNCLRSSDCNSGELRRPCLSLAQARQWHRMYSVVSSSTLHHLQSSESQGPILQRS